MTPLFIAIIALALSNLVAWKSERNTRKWLKKAYERESAWKENFDSMNAARIEWQKAAFEWRDISKEWESIAKANLK